jgi:hypothetical protein
MSKKKMEFEVNENESIEECLDRIKRAGYMPIRRTEKPIFQEVKKDNETEILPVGRQIVFEAKLIE